MSKKSEAALAFKRAVCADNRCSMWKPGGDCDGPLDAAHWIPAQRLRAHTGTLSEEEKLRCVYDPRVARPLCRRHHHRVDHFFEPPVFYEQLPQELIEYAEEWRLGWSLERDYPSLEDSIGIV